MEYKESLIIESLSVEEISKLNIATKRCATQLKDITSNAQELLSQKDYNTLLNTQEILDKTVNKRNTYKKRAEKKIEKIKKIKNSLKTKLDKFDDIKRLTCILTVDIEAFKYFSPSLEEAYDDLLEFLAKRAVENKTTASEIINIIEENIKSGHSSKFLEELEKRTKEFCEKNI